MARPHFTSLTSGRPNIAKIRQIDSSGRPLGHSNEPSYGKWHPLAMGAQKAVAAAATSLQSATQTSLPIRDARVGHCLASEWYSRRARLSCCQRTKDTMAQSTGRRGSLLAASDLILGSCVCNLYQLQEGPRRVNLTTSRALAKSSRHRASEPGKSQWR